MRPSSPPPESAAAPAAGQSTPLIAATIVSPAPTPTAPTPLRYDTRVGPTPPSPHHPRPSRRAPPLRRVGTSGLGESSSLRPQEPHSHLFRDQLMTSPWICLLLLLSGAPSSIVAQLQAIQIAVPGKCTARHTIIFQLLLPIPSSEIP